MLRKNVASQVVNFCLVNASSGAALTGATVTAKVSLDGTQSAGSGTVTELGSGQYKYVPTQAETNGTTVGFLFTATSAIPVNLHCFTIGQDPTQTTFAANATAINSVSTSSVTAVNANVGTTQPTNFTGTGASALVKSDMVDVAGAAVSTASAQIGVNVINVGGTAQTARDLGASVLISSGSGTGQLDVTSGVIKANLAQILGTALTETAGQIAAGFKKVFDVAAPVFTAASVNQTGDSYARLGAPAGASVSADIASVKTDTTNIWGAVDTEVAAILAAVDTEVASILSLLNDARTEPGQGNPPVNPNMATKVDYLYKFARNKVTQTATTLSIYADDATTVDQKATVSDDGTTYTRGELATGP